ncbi:MAG: hypothetical protein IPN34_25295 [Planctomycetes bacterium]|nr:hypothetical protein [Planctomycetota bacterium]
MRPLARSLLATLSASTRPSVPLPPYQAMAAPAISGSTSTGNAAATSHSLGMRSSFQAIEGAAADGDRARAPHEGLVGRRLRAEPRVEAELAREADLEVRAARPEPLLAVRAGIAPAAAGQSFDGE